MVDCLKRIFTFLSQRTTRNYQISQISNYFTRRGRDAQTYLEIYITIRNIRIF